MKVAGARLSAAAFAYVVAEDLLVLAALAGAFAFAASGGLAEFVTPGRLLQAAVLFAVLKAVFFWTGLYDFRHLVTRGALWRRLLVSFALVGAGAYGLCLWGAGDGVACATFLVALVPGIVLSRYLFEFLSRTGRFKKRLLFMGTTGQALRTAREILDEQNRDHELVGFLAETEADTGWRFGQREVLGTYADLERVVAERGIDRVVVAVADRRRRFPLDALLRLRIRGVEIVEEAKVHEEIAGKIPVEDLRPSWLIFADGFSQSRVRDVLKRAIDVIAAVSGLVLSAPLSLLAAAAIKLESKGPVIFSQTRVGQAGREFTLYKFRSMRNDAEKAGAQWAQANDPRVTRIGKFLRKTRIDEIPQMWNVLKGDMSFVGPRPERPVFVEQLRAEIPYYDQRHAVKPGITGWAQVRFRYGSDATDAQEKLRHDMFYIKHHSVLFDLRVILETVRVVFQRDMGR